ncbi:TPA: beta strand repeat-containing protein, partial [Haemophilus influenzae]
TLDQGFLNITAASVAFEGGNNKARDAANAKIVAQGTVTITGERKDFRANNVSLNGTGKGLNIISSVNNLTHNLSGTINISGNITINQTTRKNTSYWQTSHDSHWNVSALNLETGANFTFIKYISSNSKGLTTQYRSSAGVNFNGVNGNMSFNLKEGAKVNFKLKPNENMNTSKPLPIRFLANITATGGGSVFFDIYANHSGRGAELKMSEINISNGANFTLNSHVRGDDAFKINKDLTINATNSNFSLRQTKDDFYDGYARNAINSTYNISILGGNVTLGGQNSSSSITGNITIEKAANVTLEANNAPNQQNIRDRVIKLGSLLVNGSLSLTGENADIKGNLTISESATFKGKTRDTLNITGNFTNNGTAEINITQGVVKLGNITNDGSLNITTNAQNNQKTIINGNITNNRGDLSITDNKTNAEIQIGGNISQKEGNLTISSDKINITKQITIKKGVNGENSDSDTESQANLTIKTKELKLTEDLSISGFNKAEITAKDGRDLTIGNSNDGNSGAEAKTVTFNNVKDSKISADGHNVTLNSKVKTSSSNGGAESNSDNDTGLTITAKNVEVNKDITSLKTVNITASEKVTTTAGSTINATNGKASITTKTGDISGTISGNTVSVSASGDLTTKSGSKIEAKSGEANVTSATGTIGGTISGNTVNVTANTGGLTVGGSASISATEGAATLTATGNTLTTEAGSSITSTKGQVDLLAQNGSIAGSINAANVTLNTTGTLTTVTGSNIEAVSGALVINAQDATLNGKASGDRTEVNATNASGSGSVTAKTSSSVNITGDLSTVNGLNIISENGRNTVRLRGKEIDVKYIQPGVASVEEVIEAKRVLEKVKDLSDEERETLAKLGVSAVRFIEPNNTITVNTQNEFTTRPSSQVTISEGKACFSSGNGAAVCTNVADDGQQ